MKCRVLKSLRLKCIIVQWRKQAVEQERVQTRTPTCPNGNASKRWRVHPWIRTGAQTGTRSNSDAFTRESERVPKRERVQTVMRSPENPNVHKNANASDNWAVLCIPILRSVFWSWLLNFCICSTLCMTLVPLVIWAAGWVMGAGAWLAGNRLCCSTLCMTLVPLVIWAAGWVMGAGAWLAGNRLCSCTVSVTVVLLVICAANRFGCCCCCCCCCCTTACSLLASSWSRLASCRRFSASFASCIRFRISCSLRCLSRSCFIAGTKNV